VWSVRVGIAVSRRGGWLVADEQRGLGAGVAVWLQWVMAPAGLVMRAWRVAFDDTLNSGIRSPFSTTGIRFFCNAERAATRMGYAQAGVSTVVEYTSIGAAGGVRAGGEPWHASQPRLLRNDTALLRYGYGHHSSLQLLRPVIAESWCVGA
jgi:hypothetical protein